MFSQFRTQIANGRLVRQDLEQYHGIAQGFVGLADGRDDDRHVGIADLAADTDPHLLDRIEAIRSQIVFEPSEQIADDADGPGCLRSCR